MFLSALQGSEFAIAVGREVVVTPEAETELRSHSRSVRLVGCLFVCLSRVECAVEHSPRGFRYIGANMLFKAARTVPSELREEFAVEVLSAVHQRQQASDQPTSPRRTNVSAFAVAPGTSGARAALPRCGCHRHIAQGARERSLPSVHPIRSIRSDGSPAHCGLSTLDTISGADLGCRIRWVGKQNHCKPCSAVQPF